jgi:hypothetical protein
MHNQSLALKGKPNGRLGTHHSLETRQKQSVAQKGIPKTLEHRQKLSATWKQIWSARRSSDAQSLSVTNA